MAEIKSAIELALEKAERYGRASKEEMAVSQYQEQGRQLAVNYLKGEGDLDAELKALAPKAQEAALAAAKEVLLRNLSLPRNGETDPRASRAVEGLLLVARDKKAMARLKQELDQMLAQFLQVRHSAYQQLKSRFAATLGNMQRALEAQYRQKVRVEVEQLPQFQEEWRRFLGQLHDQFDPMLEDLKARMANS